MAQEHLHHGHRQLCRSRPGLRRRGHPAQQAPTAGTITFPHHAWVRFVHDAIEDDLPSASGVATITKIGIDTLVTSLPTDVELRFDEGEWSAFLAAVS